MDYVCVGAGAVLVGDTSAFSRLVAMIRARTGEINDGVVTATSSRWLRVAEAAVAG